MADSATIVLKGDPDPLASALNESKQNVESFGSGVGSVFKSLGALFVVNKVLEWGSAFASGFQEGRVATAELEAALNATGNTAGLTVDQLTNLADHLEDVTRFEAEATQGATTL